MDIAVVLAVLAVLLLALVLAVLAVRGGATCGGVVSGGAGRMVPHFQNPAMKSPIYVFNTAGGKSWGDPGQSRADVRTLEEALRLCEADPDCKYVVGNKGPGELWLPGVGGPSPPGFAVRIAGGGGSTDNGGPLDRREVVFRKAD